MSLNNNIVSDDTNAETPMAIIDEIRTLPPYKLVSSVNSSWGDLSGEDFVKDIDDAYAQIVHWRSNLFKVPSGACGKQFVAKLTRFFMSLLWNLILKLLH